MGKKTAHLLLNVLVVLAMCLASVPVHALPRATEPLPEHLSRSAVEAGSQELGRTESPAQFQRQADMETPAELALADTATLTPADTFALDWPVLTSVSLLHEEQLPETTVPLPTASTVMHVEAINMAVETKGKQTVVTAEVLIVDENGSGVRGAEVYATLTPPTPPAKDLTATTGPSGWAKFSVTASQTGLYELCVTDIVLAGLTYDPEQNVETCDSLEASGPPTFLMAVDPESQSVAQEMSVTFTVQLTSVNGFEDAVSLEIKSLPPDTTVEWGENPLTPSASTVLTITTAAATQLDEYRMTVVGTSGKTSLRVTVWLTVLEAQGFALEIDPVEESVVQGQQAVYTATVTSLLGFTDAVSLTVQDLPPGITSAILPNPVAPTATAAITLTTALTGTLGDHSLALLGEGGGFTQTVPFTLTVLPHPDFALVVEPPEQAVIQGQSITFTVFVTGEHGFADPVMLEAGPLPGGATAEWETNPIVPAAATTLTVTAGVYTPTGDHTVVITGTGGGFTHTAPLTLTVLAIPPDLVVESIETDPVMPIEGQPTVITMTVRNEGEDTADAFEVDWYLDPASPPGIDDTGVMSWMVDGLGAGASVALTTTHTFTETGNHALWAQVDSLDWVAEGDEENNVAGPLDVMVLSGVQEVCGTISEDTTWHSGVVYLLTCNVTVLSGVTLTMEPGVVVKPISTSQNLIVTGALLAQGTPNRPVVFTSYKDDMYGGDTNNDGGGSIPGLADWGGIEVRAGATATLDHALVLYGGYYNIDSGTTGSPGSLYVDDGTLNLSHSTVAYSGGSMAWEWGAVYARNGAALTIEGSTIRDNWEQPTYAGLVSIDSSSIITGSAFSNNSYGIRATGGQVMVSSTIFTANIDRALHAEGGQLSVTGSSFAGNGNGLYHASSVMAATIADNSFSDNQGYPMMLSYMAGSGAPSISGNILTDNAINGIGLTGSVSGTVKLLVDPVDQPFVIEDFEVLSGGRLNFAPGTVVKFNGYGAKLRVYGQLSTGGKTTETVAFTSVKDDAIGGDTNNDGGESTPGPADWGGIEVWADAMATLVHALVLYGGYYNTDSGTTGSPGSLYVDNGTLSLSYSTVANSGGSMAWECGAIHARNDADVWIEDSTIRDNWDFPGYAGIMIVESSLHVIRSSITGNQYGIYLQDFFFNSGITDSNISGNAMYGLYNDSDTLVNATFNWWGDESGPYNPRVNPLGTGDWVSDFVDFNHWSVTAY